MPVKTETRLQWLERRTPDKRRVSWYELIEGVYYARLESGVREVVTEDEVLPGYKVYSGVTPDDWEGEK